MADAASSGHDGEQAATLLPTKGHPTNGLSLAAKAAYQRPTGPNPWQLANPEAAELLSEPSGATVLAGSLDNGYVEDIITLVAARDGSPIFWNASGNANLELAGVANVFLAGARRLPRPGHANVFSPPRGLQG